MQKELFKAPSVKNTPIDCRICRETSGDFAYEGRIRLGRFGQVSQERYIIYECQTCKAQSLPAIVEDLAAFYESEAYRQEVNAGAQAANYYSGHDEEVLRHLSITSTASFRDKTVADIGCGGGSFLDAVSGFARKIIAIEPYEGFRRSLDKKGYQTYPYVQDALKRYSGKVDVAVTFSVIEHIEDPLAFLQEIRELLAPKGRLYISTPNALDVLLEVLPEDYPQFFYRKAHLWYFTPEAFENLLRKAGFQHVRIIPHQRFGLGNFLSWVHHKAPKGNAQLNYITPAIDQVWRSELERTFRCDYLYAECTVSG